MASSTESAQYTLHTYFRSSCSGRLRIALNLKSIAYTPVYFNLLKGEHQSQQNLATNPLGLVPSLVSADKPENGGHDMSLTQSLAILEYLEEQNPNARPLLPSKADILGRAHIRELAATIACDVQPVVSFERVPSSAVSENL